MGGKDGRRTRDASDPVLAAGGVLWRRRPKGAIEVLLVHRPRYDDWSFPKGKLDPGETLFETAIREVREETGFEVRMGHRLPECSFLTGDGRKEVSFWTMQPVGGRFQPSSEVDQIRWVKLRKARELVSYDHDRTLVDLLHDRPPAPVRALLVRHADAGPREHSDASDDLRPLQRRGHRQADALVPLLRAFVPTRILSARPLRCRETVQPLATAMHLPVETAEMFSEPDFADDPGPAADHLLTALVSTRVDVVSSQGEVIPSLLAWLAGSALIEPEPFVAAKGSVWALAFEGGPARADYYPPAAT